MIFEARFYAHNKSARNVGNGRFYASAFLRRSSSPGHTDFSRSTRPASVTALQAAKPKRTSEICILQQQYKARGDIYAQSESAAKECARCAQGAARGGSSAAARRQRALRARKRGRRCRQLPQPRVSHCKGLLRLPASLPPSLACWANGTSATPPAGSCRWQE